MLESIVLVCPFQIKLPLHVLRALCCDEFLFNMIRPLIAKSILNKRTIATDIGLRLNCVLILLKNELAMIFN